jgi:hypothetical protein
MNPRQIEIVEKTIVGAVVLVFGVPIVAIVAYSLWFTLLHVVLGVIQ